MNLGVILQILPIFNFIQVIEGRKGRCREVIMKDLKTFIESGILELYLSGAATQDEAQEVEEMAATFPEIKEEIALISEALALFALAHPVRPNPVIKPFLLATIDFTERMKNGETPSFPPLLHESSRVNDYSAWLNKPNMVLPEDFKDFHARIIGYTPEALTAIVWIREMAPQEIHDNEFERFLIVEGTCNITIGAQVHHLVPGDYLSIPLHVSHHVTVTSDSPCKVILQRVAA